MKKTYAFMGALVVIVLAQAQASLIDFTDDIWKSSGQHSYGDVTVTLTSNPTSYTTMETNGCDGSYGLSCDFDGIGVGDDEITWTSGNYQYGEYLTVDFTDAAGSAYGVDIEAVILLDLFDETGGREVAQMKAIDSQGGISWAVWQQDAGYQGAYGWYYGTEANDLKGSGGFFTDIVTLEFFSDGAGSFTSISNSDYALAALKLVSVPEPSSIALFLLGSVALIGARRRRGSSFQA